MLRFLRSPLCFLIILSFFAGSYFLHAETVDELQSSIANINKQLQSINKEISEYNTKISQTQGEAKTLKNALAQLEARRTGLLKQIQVTQLEIQKTQKNISLTEKNIASTTISIQSQENGIKALLNSLQKEGNKPPFLIELLQPGSSLSKAFDVISRSNDARDAMSLRVNALQEDKVTLEDAKQVYEESNKQLKDLQGTLIDQKSVVDLTSKQKSDLLTATKNKETEYQKLLEDRKARKDSLEKEVGDFEAKLKIAIDLTKLPHYGSGVLAWPLKVVKITQYFGNTPFASANPQVYTSGTHNGVDLGTPIGTPVYAAQSGVVLGTGNTDLACPGASYGNWVLIKHNNGLSTLYGHLSKIDVHAGQSLVLGERIGLSGTTGYSTGPHLHFTVYASDAVRILGPTEYVSHACGTYMVFPVSPRGGYLNPLSYL